MSADSQAQDNDAPLIDAALAGSDNAYRVLIERYHPIMVAVAGAIAGAANAEDVAQEAWVAAHRSLAKFERRSSLKTWLVRIASNEAKSRLRRESRNQSLEALGEEPNYLSDERFKTNGHWAHLPPQWHLDTPDQLLQEVELHKCINKTLTLLPAQQKAAFTLRDLEGHSLEAVAELLALSNGNARVLVHRARVTLMRVVDRYQETGQC